MQRPPQAIHRSRPLAPSADLDAADDPPPAPYPSRSSMSNPLADTRVYRPGSALATGILLLPAVLTLGLAVIELQMGRAVPVWLPVLALLWLPASPLAWVMMQTVRTSSIGIAVGRPWRAWMELPWEDIQHVEQRGLFLRISGSARTSQTQILAPRLLGDGARLRRDILLRLQPTVLSISLSHEAAELVDAGDITISPSGGIEGTIEARTLARYGATLTVAALALLAGAALAISMAVTATSALAILVAAAGPGLLGILSLALAAWLPQRLTLDARGVTITHALRLIPRRSFAWQGMDMVEYTPGRALLRIRGTHGRTRCAGPRLFSSEQSAIAWRYLEGHCLEHRVPLIKRSRLL